MTRFSPSGHHDQFGFHHFTMSIDPYSLDARHTREYVGGQQHQQLLVVVMHGGEHLVANDLATLLHVRVVYPVAAHLPSLVHVTVQLEPVW
jgi:hypothetical protein